MRTRWENILRDDFINNSKWLVLNCTLDEYINQAWNGGVFREEPTEDVIKEYAEYSTLIPRQRGDYLDFLDLFAGIGGFRRGMELAGHRCVGFCEFDKFAVASYTSMHLITEEQREYLRTLPIKKRQKEILKEEYRNGEWYANDIRRVDAGSLPKADCWCFGFPCQDISVAGKQQGFKGDRSSLFFAVTRLLRTIEEESRPKYLFIENVKNLLSVNRGYDFARLLTELDEIGYDAEWEVLNSKNFGVPQNRERVFIIGHFRGRSTGEVFPVEGADGENNIQQLANYLPTSTRDNPNQGSIYSVDGIAPCLSKMDGGGREPSVALPCFVDMCNHSGGVFTKDARCLMARYHKGIRNQYGANSGVAIPVLTPDRTNKRQNGRRFKDDGDPMFTLTRQDRHGVGISVYDMYNKRERKDGISGTLTGNGNTSTRHCGSFGVMIPVKDSTEQGYSIAQEGDAIDLKAYCSSTRRGSVRKQIAGALDHDCKQGIFVQVSGELTVYAIWHEKYQCYIAIRKLTPKECFRLQGWTDDYFEKAQFVNSDSQLYGEAGNQVTVNVIQAIAEKMED